MYDKRRKNYPAFSKSLNESIEQLKAMEDDDIIKLNFKVNNLFLFPTVNCLFVLLRNKILLL